MAREWIAFDCNSIAWRMFYGHGKKEPIPSILMSVFEMQRIARHFETENVCFTFDRKPYARRVLFGSYKSTRETRKVDDLEAAAMDEFRLAMDELRCFHLEKMGYKNIFSKKGYEADDMLAHIATSIPEGDRIILVTSDEDLYQILSKSVAVYHHQSQRFITSKWFRSEYGIAPNLWAEVKCIAGCSTDDIPGIDGVGEKTAIKFFRNELKGSEKHQKILEFNKSKDYIRNRKLVALPWPGLDPITMQEGEPVKSKAFEELCSHLKMPEMVDVLSDPREWRRSGGY